VFPWASLNNATVPINGGADSGLILNDDSYYVYLPLVLR